MLRGRCRSCNAPISPLYPLIELLTTFLLTALYLMVPTFYFFAYALFFSALIVTIRSDLETMLISRFVTLCMVPVGIASSFFELLPITPLDSIIGALLGYLFLYVIAFIFKKITGKDGMGQGDIELLACIGSFVGLIGCWITLMIGSLLGSLVGIAYLIVAKAGRNTKIPFGPFLACGAIIYVLCQDYVMTTLMHWYVG